MNLAILWLVAAGAVPDVTAGPDLVVQSVSVEAPIGEVTVYSDRARVRRKASRELSGGIHTLRLPDLPGAVLLDTVRVEVTGARVLRVEAVPIERERFSLEQIEGLMDRMEKLTDALGRLDGRISVHQLELSLLQGIQPQPAAPEADRLGKAPAAILPDAWREVLNFLVKRRDASRAELRKLALERRQTVEELTKVQREVGRHDLGAFTDQKVQVLAILQAEGGRVQLTLEYFVPGAAWWPTYDLRYLSSKQEVRLAIAGLVQQASGEDWTDVELALSTAIPGQGIELPELLTWALGEKKEFLPRAVAARMPDDVPLFPPPVARATVNESERAAKLEVLQQRISELQGLIAMDGDQGGALLGLIGSGQGGGGAGYGSAAALGSVGSGRGVRSSADKRAYDFADDSVEGELARPDAAYKSMAKEARRMPNKPMARPAAPPPRPMPSRAPMAPPAEPEAVMLEESVAVAQPIVARDGGPEGGSMGGESVRATSLALFDTDSWSAPSFADAALPAVLAGGLDYVWKCPNRVTIPSSGQRLQVPLAVESYPAKVHYEATPSLKEVAYLKAVVENGGERPILGGPVNIFMGPDFAGQGQLRTTGPKESLELPLGADEDLRLKRVVVPSSETKGVFNKDEVTTYKVTLEVGNYKKRPVKITVIDQIPKSGNEDIEIEAGAESPKPDKKIDEDGILKWTLDLPAGQVRKIEFSYRILRPENWQLYQ
ncbi:MAG TPA: mucoidy inhibitor MuiA family protein [Myxococcota bacterium]|nr:mucoidy inhibitor MuiA family protein [Myxococcota bacterium]HRY96398.1 mucoidy inhibitor MuiA family protein [Myxococcota bacterium]HSA20836.1 mucoidy inhibitor MuiA family protein [Myxococcota bacterium]